MQAKVIWKRMFERIRRFVSGRVIDASFYKIIQLIFHVQFSQFGKTTDPLAVDRDLRHRARTVGDLCELPSCRHVTVDTRFIVGNAPLAEQ